MNDAAKELFWMAGCTSVMVAVGLVALFGYVRLRQSEDNTEASR